MAPPTKRLKRNIVTSDDEDSKPVVNTLTNYLLASPDAKSQGRLSPNTTPTSPSPTRKAPRLVPLQPPKPSQSLSLDSSNIRSGKKSASANASPEKSRLRPRPQRKLDGQGKTADLKSLFTKQAERAAARPPVKLDDITSDPISDEDDVGEHRAKTASHVGLASRKRFKEASTGNAITSSSISSSQKFIRPTLPQRDPSADNEQRPWSERFGPNNLNELAVHKKKVADVRKWLEDVMAGRMRQRLLILKGAAGTGKTTTLQLLAKDMGCDVLEWRNPVTSAGAHQGFQSTSVQFEEFLGRGGKFSQLDLDLEQPTNRPATNDNTPKIMLIEEFPNTFARSSTPMTSFRKAVLQFLATNTPSLSLFGTQSTKNPITPVVMIISETLLTTTSASADSFTAHRLLGPEITRHPGTYIIEFNAIAPTLLSSALEVVVQKEARRSGRRRTPGPLVLKKLGEIGDIRSAISSLQFLCLKGDTDADWGSRVNFGKPKRTIKTSVSLTQGEVETLQLISQREASLGIFHAIGKIVYNKREEEPMDPGSLEGAAEVLPEHLASCSRPKRSEVSVDSLIDETGTDTHTFISALHENYVLSCESTTSFLDHMNECIDYLSDSDLLCPSWDVFFGGRGAGGRAFGQDLAGHVLRQEEIAFQVATRGLLFSLPNPVKRKTGGSRRAGGDSFKMFYPTSLKLWREKEELEALIDHWSTNLLSGNDSEYNVTDGSSAFRRPKTTNSAQWPVSQGSRGQITQGNQAEQTPDASSTLLSLGSSARREMILERLPYMSHIARRRRLMGSAPQLKDLEKVVSFSGISSAGDEDAVDMDENEENLGGTAEAAWATDKPTEEMSTRKKSFAIRRSTQNGGSVATLQVQKLVLSDDDIEDD
ncbi:hypothetical protein NPX13_g5033 [Xylaria arbuscula]|uniref:Checkpoint protein RAD24-like helical bundle domain-containing protein n=1 Tax=Xylaria arbuscula TaxID=114810 RepID=A0A9W8NF94_9PEZI|nr:hypothetical protein NPX13_g5033 [Xylaria arbuscula]